MKLKRAVFKFQFRFSQTQLVFRGHVLEAKMFSRLISNSGKRKNQFANFLGFFEDFDEVLATQGQPFLLTQSQAQSLNDMLNEHFEELKINELKGVA